MARMQLLAVSAGVVALASMIALPANAQTPTSTREALNERRAELQADLQKTREDLRSGSSTPQEVSDRMKAERAEVKDELQQRREDLRTKAEEVRTTKIAKLAAVYAKRFDAAYDRLSNIKSRIADRMADFAARGIDVSAVQAALDKATPLIAEAKTSIDALKAALLAAEANPADTAAREAVKEKASAAKEDLKAAHAALVEAITKLKASRPLQTDKATSTNATSSPNQ